VGAVLGNVIAVGATLNIYGVFVNPVAESLGASIAVMGLAPTIWQCVTGLGAPIVGRLAGRVALRSLMLTGAVALALGLILLSRVESLWQASLLLAGLVAVGSSLLGLVPTATLVTNWYVERRGFALGMVAAGATGSGMLLPPLAAWLVGEYGWRQAFLILGIGVATVTLPCLLALIVDKPEDVGETPDGIAPAAEAEALKAPLPMRAILAERNFWLIALAFGPLFAASLMPVLFTVPYAVQIGLTLQGGAWIMSARSGAAIVGKIAISALSDRLGRRPVVWGVIAAQFLLWSALVETRDFGIFAALSIAMGFVASALPLQNALVGATFGRESFPRAMGLLVAVELPFQLLTAPVAGAIVDATGDYAAAFRAFMPVFLLSAILLAFVKDRPVASSPAQST